MNIKHRRKKNKLNTHCTQNKPHFELISLTFPGFKACVYIATFCDAGSYRDNKQTTSALIEGETREIDIYKTTEGRSYEGGSTHY